MELNINTPAYFTALYGVNDEVYKYCQQLYTFFKDKEYSPTLTTIGIVPIIAPKELYEQGKWKEKVQMISLGTCAIINIRMNFEIYYEADDYGKIALMNQMIIKAIKKIKRKGQFDDEQFKKDLASITQKYIQEKIL